MPTLKQPRVLPHEAEEWINKFNAFFKEHTDPGIVFIFSSPTKEKPGKIVSGKNFSQIKGICHKIILLSEPEAKFIPSADFGSTEFHANIVLNDIGDDVCFSSQAILDDFEKDFIIFEINPGGADRALFVLKFRNFSEEEKYWIASEVKNMSFRCLSCASNSKDVKAEHLGIAKEKFLAATGSH